MIQAAKIIGSGLATIGLVGAGVVIPDLPEYIDAVNPPLGLAGNSVIIAILLGVSLYHRFKKAKKPSKPSLRLHLVPVSLKEGMWLHVGVVDLNNPSGYNLRTFFGSGHVGANYKLVNTIHGPFMALMFFRSATLEFYYNLIQGCDPLSLQTFTSLDFILKSTHFSYLQGIYNLEVYTGVGVDKVRVVAVRDSIDLAITPYFFCYSTNIIA
jgi:hypothetical protein